MYKRQLAAFTSQAMDSSEIVQRLSNLQFGQLGSPQVRSDTIHPVYSDKDRPHKLLIIPVQYVDQKFDRFNDEPNGDKKNQRYLEKLLFSKNLEKPEPKTLTHYYYHQSKGRYYVTGKVFPVITVQHTSSYYGKPLQNSDGQWRNDTDTQLLVEHAMAAALQKEPDFPWEDFDNWDPMDYDGDGKFDEADGYVDHFVLVFAGKGQSSCQGLFNLDQKFTSNAPVNIYETLHTKEQECAQRIWPHRASLRKNIGKGPEVEGFVNRRGGLALKPGLWVYDFNMQSEYTEVSTFIHEFGHSLGLPDVYARKTNNSTASWEVMSSTIAPVPQEMSAWSRMMLGWLKPCIVTPSTYGGGKVQSIYLKTMNDWSPRSKDKNAQVLCDAAMVILPPKTRTLDMGPLGEKQKHQAAYTGQGNELNHYLSRQFDLTRFAADEPIKLEFDAWFQIEADWDYLYVEASLDGQRYQRLMPTDKAARDDVNSIMPSQRGHDGVGTTPGFTGRSGDLDGDGKVESASGCDPAQAKLLAEDRIGKAQKDPCDSAIWIHSEFDLEPFSGHTVDIRFHYFTDGAAVKNGALIDNVKIKALDYFDDFELDNFQGWRVDGFSLSTGHHELSVPHFYLLEYRDPQEEFRKAYNYDSHLNEPMLSFFNDSISGDMKAMDVRYRSGVLAWYYNGAYLWSQNEPSQFGPGNGFLLLVDSNPQEYNYPGIAEQYYKNDKGWRYYDFDEEAQNYLKKSFLEVMCFQRRAAYFPPAIQEDELIKSGLQNIAGEFCRKAGEIPAVERLSLDGKKLIYDYTLINEILPGKAREAYRRVSTLFDLRLRAGEVSYRMYDRRLRNFHSADAPFALGNFDSGIQFYRVDEGRLIKDQSLEFSPTANFSDADSSMYLNPHLPFGGVDIPNFGLQFKLAKPDSTAPASAKVKIYIQWER
ncbi:MAG: immune inhibitor A [Pseudomonadales bacterium]|nr:immune inhibitor A [Pseudomonadales bacterium]